MFKHASIVPLIGGIVIGQEEAFGSRPDYLMSYAPFANHDSHLVNWYGADVPYLSLDSGQKPFIKAEVISTCCPCAGLSMLSHGYGDHNQNNQWMDTTARYVLGELKPKVFFGENAPGLAGKIGDNVRANLQRIGKENGYTFSIYRTRTLLHGGCQVRERAFYFFWKDIKVPALSFYNEPYTTIEAMLESAVGNSQRDPINDKTPSVDDPYYTFVLEEIHGGITHREFHDTSEPASARNCDILSYIERKGYTYRQVGEWMRSRGLEKEAVACERRHEKLSAGGSIMRRGTVVPKEYIGAFVNHYPHKLTHHIEDRYINYREAMTIMGLPQSFELLDPKKNTNHVCQNVPVKTARDMAHEVMLYLDNKLEMIDTDYMIQYNAQQKNAYESRRVIKKLGAFV